MQPTLENSALNRQDAINRLKQTKCFDLLVIGGGATGLGIALDAASRGLSVALVERSDYAKGTSSRATKLVHGGVRYLAQGNISLVREALHERKTLLDNAPHLAQPLSFLMPSFGFKGRFWDKPLYSVGLMLYDRLAGERRLGNTECLGRQATLATLPGVRADNLVGSVRYWDGQFDDARLAVMLARTATAKGATLLNYCPVTALLHSNSKVSGARVSDQETGEVFDIHARCIINATGVWVDELRRMDTDPASQMVAPSQGIHLVVEREFLPGDHALLVPKTDDGRVLFAVPWLGKVLLGTTDTPRDTIEVEPIPLAGEIDFILGEAGKYLARQPKPADIRSIWGGLRPLVKPPGPSGKTQALSREHTILIDSSGLVTVTGGKWTTYRAMAEDVIQHCQQAGLIDGTKTCVTGNLALTGAPTSVSHKLSDPPGEHLYGTEADLLHTLPGSQRELGMQLSEAMVRFAVRYEGARSIEDVLARRSRILFLDAALAARLAKPVCEILTEEIGARYKQDDDLARFATLSGRYSNRRLQ